MEATQTPAAPANAVPPPVAAPNKFTIPDDPKPVAAPVSGEVGPSANQNTGDQPTPAKPDGDKPETLTPEQEAKRKQSRFDRKIDKAYRRAAEAQARADLLEKELAKVRPAATADTEAPTLEKHNYDPEAYAAAKAKYETEKTLRERETTAKTEAQKQAQAQLVSQWEENAEKGSEKYEDFDAVVGKIEPTSPLTVAIMKAENGHDIAYHLGKNLKEAQRIAALDPVSQIFELGRIAAKLSAEPEKPKMPSKAPAPITPLTGATPTAATAEPSENDDTATWIKKRQKQVHGRR